MPIEHGLGSGSFGRHEPIIDEQPANPGNTRRLADELEAEAAAAQAEALGDDTNDDLNAEWPVTEDPAFTEEVDVLALQELIERAGLHEAMQPEPTYSPYNLAITFTPSDLMGALHFECITHDEARRVLINRWLPELDA